jgi:hypothetical protein
MLAALGTAFGHAGASAAALALAVQHLFGRQAFDITAAMGALLGLDLLFATVVAVIYTLLRARRVQADRSF